MRGRNRTAGLRFVQAATIAFGAIGVALLAGAPVRLTALPSGYRLAAEESAEATAVWEEAIRAKGGRERLHAIRNFVMTSHTEFADSPRPDVLTYADIECLYIPPNRLWEYVDSRPGRMGDRGLALDVDHHRVLNIPRNYIPGWTSAQGAYDDLVYQLRNGQFLYLMETEHVRPEPVRLTRGRLDRLDVDIVETRVNGDRVEFSLDRRSHLPVRVLIQEQRPVLPEIYRLGDYHAVEGIQMPGNVHFGDDSRDKTPTTYRFNVEYDESIFIPGSVRFEKNGWMKR